ncbi:HAMP domain-containing sensor histidine kinase (plasmid) [Deinococcus radiomollis]|uniref:sensor histidine kinase n=1 Tax=Deinococcus radiomollis TaxID=468916 RepID=UPI003891FDF9
MTLRWRLTLYSALVSSVIVLLSALLIFFSLRTSLLRGLDASLREAATIAATQLGGDEGAQISPESASDRVQSKLPGSTVLLVFNKAGVRVDEVGVPRVRTPLVPGYVTLSRERIYTLRLPQGGWVQASRSVAETNGTLTRAVRVLLFGLPPLLLFGVVAGYLLADRSLRPVDAVARLAASIATSGHYQQRVPLSPGQDEMARLTLTVNAMLERLASTIDREKAFALAAAHELRTPLSVLKGSADLSLERPRTPEQYVRTLETVQASSAEMLHITESLLALARTNSELERLPTDLAGVITQAVAGQLAFASSQGMHLHLNPDVVMVDADAALLELAVSNLIRNSLTYGFRGGEVWVRSAADGPSALIEVSDDGPGLSDDDLGRVVQPFQRGHRQQVIRGAGLGLALVNAIAEQHGGTFTLDRRPGGGLTTELRFPSVRQERRDRPSTRTAGKQATVPK